MPLALAWINSCDPNPLPPARAAFTSLSLLAILRFPIFQLPQLINGLVAASVSVQRLQQLLLAEEQEPMEVLPPAGAGETALELEGEFSWDAGAAGNLVDVHLRVRPGELVAVVGATGETPAGGPAGCCAAVQQGLVSVQECGCR